MDNDTLDKGLSRRERERLRRRQAMLDAAQAVFAERGYGAATLDEVAERAEFGKGTLYNYFPDGKEEILFAIFDQLYDEVATLVRTSLDEADDGTRSIDAIFRHFLEQAFHFFDTREDLFVILIKEAYRMVFSDDAEKVRYFLGQRRRLVGLMTPLIERAIEAGTVRPFPPQAVALILMGTLDQMHQHRLFVHSHDQDCPPEAPSAEQSADFLATLLFEGLLVRPTDTSSSSAPSLSSHA